MGYIYEQLSGKLYDSTDAIIAIGYSGFGDHKNVPADQGLYDLGPIVAGTYTITGPPQDTTSHGPYVLRLIPDEFTRLFILGLGRDPDSFLCHGDSVAHSGAASHGCLILSRDIRQLLWQNIATEDQLQVVSGEVPIVDPEISV